ncbi:uncharacterized protein [Dermacentor albipictus]|uniref:uncharacterized protein n=1 Tax=Dermacentor albipictus TaxID=60249 RepID=UPI0031FD45B5
MTLWSSSLTSLRHACSCFAPAVKAKSSLEPLVPVRRHSVVSQMTLRTASRSGRWLTLVLLVLWRASPAASESTHNQTDGNSSATIETYSADDAGSPCPFMSGIGTAILRGIADSPDDAYVLEEAAENPDAGAVKELVTYHQRGVNLFLTFLWGVVIFFSIFMIAAIIQVLYILCTGTFKHYVAKSNTCAYIFCVIAVSTMLIVMIVLLVFLIGCRGALADSAGEKVPAVYVLTFDNLRKFFRLTVTEASIASGRIPKVQRVLGDGFGQAFGDFVAKISNADDNVPLFRLDSECTEKAHFNNVQLADGDVWLPEKSSAPAEHCARIRHMQGQLFDKIVRSVAVSTVQYRRELSEILSDLTFVAEASDDSTVLASIESIDRLQKSVDEYEKSKGTFGTLYREARDDFFWLNIFLLVCLIALTITLLMGVAVHDRTVKPQRRSNLSHVIGFLFVTTAFLFGMFVVISIFTTMYLTIVSTLGYCYLCESYMDERYSVLDDALERLWPSSNRSSLLSKITPSKIMGNCQNDSISSIILSPKLTRHTSQGRYFFQRAGTLTNYEPYENPSGSNQDTFIAGVHMVPLHDESCVPDASFSELESVRSCKKNARNSLRTWSRLSHTAVRLNRAEAEKALLRAAPFYFGRFVEELVNAVNSLASTGGGRCSILRSILSSFMDVVCVYVLELVGYWASLMLATFTAIIAIPFCFVLSKYFFRTRRRKSKERRVELYEESSSAAESLTTQSFTTQQETPPEVTRRVVYQSQSTRTYDPYTFISPSVVRQTSFTSYLSRIPLQNIRRIDSSTTFSPVAMVLPGNTVCHHHHHSQQHYHHYHPPQPAVIAPVHSPSCILSVPTVPVMLHSPRSSLTVQRVDSHTAVGPDSCRRSSGTMVAATAATTVTHHVGSSPAVVLAPSKPSVVVPPTSVLVQPPTVVTSPPVVVAPPPTVLTQPATVLTTPPTVAVQPPPVPLVVQTPPSAPPVAASPIGTGPAENQQAATAHMTINFYGNPAGGTFGIPMAGYPAGYPAAGYITAAGQPYYYTAAPAAYAAAMPAATPVGAQPVAYATATPAAAPATTQTVAYAVPTGQAAGAYQYAFAMPQLQQSISTASVSSTHSVRTLPSTLLRPAVTVPVAASAPIAVQPAMRVSSVTRVRSLQQP